MKLQDTVYQKEEFKSIVNEYFYETFNRFDFIANEASGNNIFDENGECYLDFMAGIAVNSAGHCNKRVVEAIKNQCETLIHASNYFYTVPQAMCAKLICDSIGMEKIYFQNSGAEANEAMIKLARKYGTDNFGPNKYKIITAKNSFHGRTIATLTATGQEGTPIQNGYSPLMPGFIYADYNDLDSFKSACSDDTIAIMVEVIQGEGGVIPATMEFIKGLRELCDERNMLLLFDEVQTGWGRTGDLMGYMSYGVKPDALSMAKAMGGGMPIGAMCTTAKIAKTFGPGAHGSTYAGNPVCCAAAHAQISEIIEEKLFVNAKEMGIILRNLLRKLPFVKEVRGLGLLVGVEFTKDIANELKYKCAENKLLITAVRPNVIRLVPPINIKEEDCIKANEIILKSINQVIE